MKRLMIAVIAALVLFAISESFAFHVIGEEVKTKVSWRTDFVSPEDGDLVIKEWLWTHFQKGDAGLGIRLFAIPKNNYLRLRVQTTLKTEFVTPVIGISTDSAGKDHINVGIQYARKLIRKLKLFTDVRGFWGLNGKSTDLLETFTALSYPINSKVFVGTDIFWYHYWDSGNNWYLMGTPVGYKFSDELTVFVRPSVERLTSKKNDPADAVAFRIGVNYSF